MARHVIHLPPCFELEYIVFFIDLLVDGQLVYICTMAQKPEGTCLLVFSKIKAL